MLELRNIRKTYTSGFFFRRIVRAADNINLKINQGKIIGLIGPSGSGKSTLGKIILGLEPPDEGCVLFNGRDIRCLNRSGKKWFCRNVQMVPQHPDAAFNPKLKIRRSLIEVFRFHDLCPDDEQENYLEAALKHVHIHPGLIDRYPFQLSGGEIQRLTIARAILLKPAFLVLDEVTSMLDVSVQAQIVRMLQDLHRTHTAAYLFITHNQPLAEAICDEIYSIQEGRLSRF